MMRFNYAVGGNQYACFRCRKVFKRPMQPGFSIPYMGRYPETLREARGFVESRRKVLGEKSDTP